jgi:hypothetical protein
MPYGLQIASGWTSLSVIKNIVAVAIVVPALFFSVHHFGMIGAAGVWASLNVGYLIFEIPIMHRRLLKHALASWYARGLVLPIICTVAIGATSRYFAVPTDNRLLGLAVLVAYASLTTACLAVVMPSIRRSITALLSRKLGRAPS